MQKRVVNKIRTYIMNISNYLIEGMTYTIKIKKRKAVANFVKKVKEIIHNRGTGAGGANTNHNGKLFEKKTCNEQRLLDMGYSKIEFSNGNYFLSKTFEDKTVVFSSQKAFRKYMKQKFNLEMIRDPDEAYIFHYNNGRKVVKILEKKNQNISGSVEDKLWNGPSYQIEYESIFGKNGDKFEVCYAYCVSSFLENKFVEGKRKFKILN